MWRFGLAAAWSRDAHTRAGGRTLMLPVSLIFTSGVASGVNCYAVVLILGLLGRFGSVAAALGVLSLTLRVMAGCIDNGVYDRLGGSWWDETSLLNVLHGSVTPGRFGYFRGVLARQFGAGVAGL